VAEGTCILTRSYLACLVDKNFFTKFYPGEVYDEPFGKRHNYLKSLPPFLVDKAWYALQGIPVPLELEDKQLAYGMLVKLQVRLNRNFFDCI